MRIKVPLLAVPIVHVPTFLGQEMPAGLGAAFDEHMRSQVRNRVAFIPLDVIRFVRIRPARTDTFFEVDQHDRSEATSLRKVARPDTDQTIIAAGNSLGVHVHGRGIVGHAVPFPRRGSVRIHGPYCLPDTSALVDVFPAVIHDTAVAEHHRAEFADRTVSELFDIGAVRVHSMQPRSH